MNAADMHDTEIQLDRPGEAAETVTAVRLREDPLPPEYSEIRAVFTSQFGNYAGLEPLYELPDVDEQLTTERVYTSGHVEPPRKRSSV